MRGTCKQADFTSTSALTNVLLSDFDVRTQPLMRNAEKKCSQKSFILYSVVHYSCLRDSVGATRSRAKFDLVERNYHPSRPECTGSYHNIIASAGI